MYTIKLPIQNEINISDLQRQFNNAMRISYNRFLDGLSEKEIRDQFKSHQYNNLELLDSWFIQCVIKEGKSWFEKTKNTKPMNFKNRLHPIHIQGEAPKNGNRKFQLDIENQKIVFKISRTNHIEIQLPNLRNNYFQQLSKLQELASENKIAYSIRIEKEFIYISINDEKLIEEKKEWKSNRVFGIDLNPNYLGWSVIEFNENDTFKVLDFGVIDNKELNLKLGVSSDSKEQKYQNNKKEFESFEISKFLIEKCNFYHCSSFACEDLDVKTKDHKMGRDFNRLVNNCWNRNKLISNLKKRCNLENIEFKQVGAWYSSFIGNILYGTTCPDMVAASVEIARRSYHQYQKGWFYPELITITDLSNRWKNAKDWCYKNWIELYNLINKTLKLRYRSSLETFDFEVFRLKDINSKINLYQFI